MRSGVGNNEKFISDTTSFESFRRVCRIYPPGLTGQGYFAPLSEAIKSIVSIPVILTGGITEVEAAEKFLKEKKADLIGVGRAILQDSTWAKRAIEKLGSK